MLISIESFNMIIICGACVSTVHWFFNIKIIFECFYGFLCDFFCSPFEFGNESGPKGMRQWKEERERSMTEQVRDEKNATRVNIIEPIIFDAWILYWYFHPKFYYCVTNVTTTNNRNGIKFSSISKAEWKMSSLLFLFKNSIGESSKVSIEIFWT